MGCAGIPYRGRRVLRFACDRPSLLSPVVVSMADAPLTQGSTSVAERSPPTSTPAWVVRVKCKAACTNKRWRLVSVVVSCIVLSVVYFLVAGPSGSSGSSTGPASPTDECANPCSDTCSVTTLDNPWRSVNNTEYGPYGNKIMVDRNDTMPGTVGYLGCFSSSSMHGTRVGGDKWYRFSGMGGDALPLQPPVPMRCGTYFTGWLSGWSASDGVGPGCKFLGGHRSGPPCNYTKIGRYPATKDGVVERTVCFQDTCARGNWWEPIDCMTCAKILDIKVARCAGFLLWQLPYTECAAAYCTAPSGI